MVKVWYEPPPYGPKSALNRPAYGVGEGSTPRWLQKLSRMPTGPVIVGSIGVVMTLAYLPLLNQKLPFTLSPEYLAAQRAYMRYHNMNPIYGISSK